MSGLKQRKRLPTNGYNTSFNAIKSISGLTLALDYRFGVYRDTALTQPAAIGDSVKGWQDRSGNNYHATESTNPPTLASDGLTFDGVNDVLRVARMTGQFGAGFSWFWVGNIADGIPAVQYWLWGSLTSAPNNSYFALVVNSISGICNVIVYQNATAKITTINTFVDGASSDFIAGATANPSGNLTGYFNGARAGTPIAISALTWSSIAGSVTETPYIGALNFNNSSINNLTAGTIKSLIIYNRPLTTTELTQVHRYLGNKYAITVP